jgi:hypothetical protein
MLKSHDKSTDYKLPISMHLLQYNANSFVFINLQDFEVPAFSEIGS